MSFESIKVVGVPPSEIPGILKNHADVLRQHETRLDEQAAAINAMMKVYGQWGQRQNRWNLIVIVALVVVAILGIWL